MSEKVRVAALNIMTTSELRMGYDGLFFGRLDYADKERRMRDREMEMVWRGDRGDTSGEADLLTGALFHAYRCRRGKGREGKKGQ